MSSNFNVQTRIISRLMIKNFRYSFEALIPRFMHRFFSDLFLNDCDGDHSKDHNVVILNSSNKSLSDSTVAMTMLPAYFATLVSCHNLVIL